MPAQRSVYYFRVARKIVYAFPVQHLHALRIAKREGSGAVRAGGGASLSPALHVGRVVLAWAAYVSAAENTLMFRPLFDGKVLQSSYPSWVRKDVPPFILCLSYLRR
jgi:hypothetical protein